MEALIPLVAILMVFGTPLLIVRSVIDYKLRRKQLERGEGDDAKQLQLQAAAHEREKKALEARIQNLESIVCSVDFELNQRLNRLAAGASQAAPAQLGGPAERKLLAAPDRGGTMAERAVPAAAVLQVGQQVLGRYMIERELGRGGMGAVYLARDAKLGERVALKTIASSLAGDPEELADRFRREVQAARKVTHANVIRIHDLGEDGSLLFLSMEYVEGETLASRIRRLGPFDVHDGLQIVRAVSAGVAAAHAVGVIHRDVKPQNVIIGTGGGERIVKVIDFGLAKVSFTSGMTATGMILGTPEYMAPEQIRGSACDERTDVYALGALAYCVLTGRPPFTGASAIEIGFATVHDPPRSPRELRPEIPEAVERTILRALEKDPPKRFPDAAAWSRALG